MLSIAPRKGWAIFMIKQSQISDSKLLIRESRSQFWEGFYLQDEGSEGRNIGQA